MESLAILLQPLIPSFPQGGSTGSFPPSATTAGDDSDSDLEDFNDVLEESRKALHFTEVTLQKKRKDPLETGIFLDPAEYVSQRYFRSLLSY